MSTGYAPPVDASLLQANPTWIGYAAGAPAAGAPPAGVATPAGPVSLPVPAATPVDAVTAGTVSASGSTVTLTGSDGAIYTTTGVTPSPALAADPAGTPVAAGQPVGTAQPGGVTFEVAIPDVTGPVCADDALQAWSAGMATDVHALPASCVTGGSAPANPVNVLVATDQASGDLGAQLAQQFAGTKVTTWAATVDPTTPATAQASAVSAKEPTPANLVVVDLPDATPTTAASLVPLLPANQPVLWVAPPSADPATAAAYRALVAAHPNLRVESPPAPLAALTSTAAGPLGGVTPEVLALLASRYADTAYRLPATNAQTGAVLTYAEGQLGKPYVWAGAGPADFDCSGLTMQAYAAAGMALPHNAEAQYQLTQANAVPQDQLQPGDLVFFGSSIPTIEHVGIYIGDGTFLDAPHTGAVVRFDHLGPGWDYQGATRPLGIAGSSLGPDSFLAGGSGLGTDQSFAQAVVSAIWGPTQFGYLQQLWQRESGWDPASTNATSGAYGIAQALPASKMASISSDWANDPFTQILWGITYIQSRYGTPQAAWAHELAAGWY